MPGTGLPARVKRKDWVLSRKENLRYIRTPIETLAFTAIAFSRSSTADADMKKAKLNALPPEIGRLLVQIDTARALFSDHSTREPWKIPGQKPLRENGIAVDFTRNAVCDFR